MHPPVIRNGHRIAFQPACQRVNKPRRTTSAICALIAATGAGTMPAYAGLTATGDVSPSNLATWTAATSATIGSYGTGSLTVNAGSVLTAFNATLGRGTGAAGVSTVDGSGSNWTIMESLTVGYAGTGTLIISNGATVTVAESFKLASHVDGVGTVDFGAFGGTLTVGALYASPSQFIGTGTVNAASLVVDDHLIFDAANGLTQSLIWNSSSQSITVKINLNSSIKDLGVGYGSVGSLAIKDGRIVNSSYGYLGYITPVANYFT